MLQSRRRESPPRAHPSVGGRGTDPDPARSAQVTRTRLYNAPPGRYAGGVDAALALARIEGPTAFYKGSLTHFLRLGPHMVLVFGILEQIKMLLHR